MSRPTSRTGCPLAPSPARPCRGAWTSPKDQPMVSRPVKPQDPAVRNSASSRVSGRGAPLWTDRGTCSPRAASPRAPSPPREPRGALRAARGGQGTAAADLAKHTDWAAQQAAAAAAGAVQQAQQAAAQQEAARQVPRDAHHSPSVYHMEVALIRRRRGRRPRSSSTRRSRSAAHADTRRYYICRVHRVHRVLQLYKEHAGAPVASAVGRGRARPPPAAPSRA